MEAGRERALGSWERETVNDKGRDEARLPELAASAGL